MTVKNLEYYLSLNYPMTMQWDNDDKTYFVEFPDLPGCMAHGTTPTSAVKLAQKFKKEWLTDVLASGFSIAEPKTDDDYSGKFVARLTPALHRRLAEQAASDGRSLNAHVVTLLSERSAALTVEKSVAGAVNNIEIAMGKAMSKIEEKVNAAVAKLERATAIATSNAHYAIAGHFSAAGAVPAKFYGQYI